MRQRLFFLSIFTILFSSVINAATLFTLERVDIRANWNQLRAAAEVLKYQNARIEHTIPLPNHEFAHIIFTHAKIRGENNFVLFGEVSLPRDKDHRVEKPTHSTNHKQNKSDRQAPSLAELALDAAVEPAKTSSLSDERTWRPTDKNKRPKRKFKARNKGNITLTVRNHDISGHLFTGEHNYSIRPVAKDVFRIVPARESNRSTPKKIHKQAPPKVWEIGPDDRP